MIRDFKIVPTMLLRQLNLLYCRFSIYFTCTAKEKLHFSFNMKFLLLLSERGWALKVA